MEKMNNKSTMIRDVNIIDMILIDHRVIKEYIETLSSEDRNKYQKLKVAKEFLTLTLKHSQAEEDILYPALRDNDVFHSIILAAEIEHQIFQHQIKHLRPRVIRSKKFSEAIEAELNVLIGLVRNHLKNEESELLSQMNTLVEKKILVELGVRFMKKRKMTISDFENYPHLRDELIHWKDDVQKVSSKFLSQIDKFVENLKH
jgi:hemerythrin superfamily protein